MNPKKIDRVFLILFVIFAFGALFFRFAGLNQELWLDESGQYWIGVGKNHYSQELTRGTIADVWRNNRSYNFDPPLFSTAVYVWTLFSSSIYWLRMLPTLCGLVVVFYLYKTLNLYKVNTTLKVGILTFLLGNYFVIYYSKEFRAFSMTQALVMAAIFYFARYLKDSKDSDYFKLVSVNLLGMLSLYSFWLLFPPLYLVLALKNRKKIPFYLLTSISYLVFALAIYWSQIQFQKAGFSLIYANHFKLSSYQFPKNIQNLYIFHKEHWRYLFGYSPMFGSLNVYLAKFFRFDIKAATYLFVTVNLTVTAFLRKNVQGKEVFLVYLLFILFISTLSFLGSFPIGPNRWNLFYAPIEFLLFALVCNALWNRFSILPATLLVLLIVINLSQYSFFPRQGPFLEQLLKSSNLTSDQYLLYSYDVVPSFKYLLKTKGGSKEQFYYTHNYDNIISHRQENLENYISNNYSSIIKSTKPLHIVFTGTDPEAYTLAKTFIEKKVSKDCTITEHGLLKDRMITLACNY